MGAVTVGVLGPLEVCVGDAVVPVAGAKQRAVLAALALHAHHVVPAGELVDLVWGEPAPDRAEHTLQQHISTLRKLLEPGRGADPPSVLLTRAPGYLIAAEVPDRDAFTASAAAGHAALAAERHDDAVTAFDAALAAWRGAALADAGDAPRLRAAATRLGEQRLAAVEGRVDALVASGRHGQAVPELEHLVVEHPFREHLRAALMLALYRSGRQADALAAYQQARAVLADELGLDPGPALRELEARILAQDPALASSAPASSDANPLHRTFRTGGQPVAGVVVLPDGQTVTLAEGTATIGRSPEAEIRLVDSRVSRRHATITVDGSRATLQDLGSTNGTAVGGRRVDDHMLADGDEIVVGGVMLRFQAGEPPGRPRRAQP